jgi:hypothetical protein
MASMVCVRQDVWSYKGVYDCEHRVLHGGGGIKMPSVAYRMLWGEHSMRGVWPHDAVKIPILKRNKRYKSTHSRVPGTRTTASKSQPSSSAVSTSYFPLKKASASEQLPKSRPVPFRLRTIHHFFPALGSMYVPRPFESMCNQLRAPVVAARPHRKLFKGGASSCEQPKEPFVAFQAAESVEKGHHPIPTSGIGKFRPFRIFPSSRDDSRRLATEPCRRRLSQYSSVLGFLPMDWSFTELSVDYTLAQNLTHLACQ